MNTVALMAHSSYGGSIIRSSFDMLLKDRELILLELVPESTRKFECVHHFR